MLVYALVADGGTVLAEFTPKGGNFISVARDLLREIPRENDTRAYKAHNVKFTYISDDSGLVVLCMSTTGDTKTVVIKAFLDDVRRTFLGEYSGGAYHNVRS